MYAVIKTGGKQFKVSEGETLKIEKLTTEVGKKISISNVLTLVWRESYNWCSDC